MQKQPLYRFLNHVQEVLNNVCKTEESLRRLKNRNQPISEDVGQGSTDTISDEKKIRAQIKLDIDYFVKSVGVFIFLQLSVNDSLVYSCRLSVTRDRESI